MPAKKYLVALTDVERAELSDMVRKGKADANKIKHAHILLKAETGGAAWDDKKIADTFGCHRNTVENIRKRFVTEGLAAAIQRKKREQPPVAEIIDGEVEARLIQIACGKAPGGRAQWTMQLLADKLVELEIVPSVSDETVRRKLKKTNLNRTCASAG